MVLLEVPIGTTVRVTAYHSEGDLEGKLRQLGLMPGDPVRVLRKAPLQGPVLLEIGGREIALGVGIAALIEVEDVPCVSP